MQMRSEGDYLDALESKTSRTDTAKMVVPAHKMLWFFMDGTACKFTLTVLNRLGDRHPNILAIIRRQAKLLCHL